jgi:hypothetical protein
MKKREKGRDFYHKKTKKLKTKLWSQNYFLKRFVRKISNRKQFFRVIKYRVFIKGDLLTIIYCFESHKVNYLLFKGL